MTNRVVELISKANRAHAEGRMTEAKLFAEQVLELNPASTAALSLLGVIEAKQGRYKLAIHWLEEAERIDPTSFHVAFWRSLSYRALNQIERAMEAAKLAINRDPLHGSGYNQLGLCRLHLGWWAKAETDFRAAIQRDPEVSTLYENLGRSLHKQRRRKEALQAFEHAITLDPTRTQVLLRLGNTLVTGLDYGSARLCAERVLSIDSGSVAGHLLMAKALIGVGEAGEAESHAMIAVRAVEGSPEAHSIYASVLDALGRTDEARSHYQRSLEIQPRQGFCYYGLVRNRKMTASDQSLLDQALQILEDPQTGPSHYAYLQYALGKGNEDLGDFQSAMQWYDLANQSVVNFNGRPSEGFEQESEDQRVQTVAHYDPAFFERAKPFCSDDDLPIFVVGMMRSGTTLVEQILSSHPEIGAAGEQPFWLANGTSNAAPDSFLALIHEYLQTLRKIAPGKSKVVDKMPNNYRQLGAIHAAFPEACIVHIRRHPVDTCLSLWSTPRATPPEWRNEKRVIVSEYENYLRYMDHWRKVLPRESLLEIEYEDLVFNPEQVTRGLIDFCGVEWNPDCLSPERNHRAVNTPSVAQVRQPVFRSSVDRWRKFEPWLQEFRSLLPTD